MSDKYTIDELINECYTVLDKERQDAYDGLNQSLQPNVILSLLPKVVELTNRIQELENER